MHAIADPDAEATMRLVSSGGQGFPSSEAWTLDLTVLGFPGGGRQTLAYKRFTRCEAD